MNLRRERLSIPEPFDWREERREQFFFGSSLHRADDERGEISTGIDGFPCAMGRPRAVRRASDRRFRIAGEEQRHWREPHERSVAGGELIGAARPWLAVAFERRKRLKHGAANVETAADAAVMPFALPAEITTELIDRVKTVAFDKALGEAECHRRVVRPLPWLEIEWSAADDVGDRFKGAWRFELERRAECIAGRESDDRAAVAFLQRGHARRSLAH